MAQKNKMGPTSAGQKNPGRRHISSPASAGSCSTKNRRDKSTGADSQDSHRKGGHKGVDCDAETLVDLRKPEERSQDHSAHA